MAGHVYGLSSGSIQTRDDVATLQMCYSEVPIPAGSRPPSGFRRFKQFRGEKVHAHTSCSDSRVLSDRPCRYHAGRSPVRGQAAENRATGETYHVEMGAYSGIRRLTLPSPANRWASSARRSISSMISASRRALQTAQDRARPGDEAQVPLRVHADHLHATATLHRNIIFNGILYPVSLPVESEMKWRRTGSATNGISSTHDRGFVGLLLEAKYTDVQATLTNVLDTEFVRARAPIPAIGGIGRVYRAATSQSPASSRSSSARNRGGLRRPVLRLRCLRHRQLHRLRRRPGGSTDPSAPATRSTRMKVSCC